ncbi:hypothetical protein [Bacteroides sp.]|uniref:hypothetical protein n=1 Tax=Bacteroides sp. TaxID=29523 RepID=UPI003AB77BAE
MIKYFCTEDQNVPLQQNVRPIAAGRTSHYGRTYVPLWQNVITCRTKSLSRR